jgi:short-subunit dehydrogenase
MSLNSSIKDWKDHRVWIIGASSGIGRALAEAWLERGARVAVSARSAEALMDIRSQYPDHVIAVAMDATDENAQCSAMDTLKIHNFFPQTVLYCAGYYSPMRADQFNLSEALRHDDVNYRGALITLSNVLPTLLKQGSGRIAFVSSVAGFRGLPNSLAYGPTKAALINLAETLYMDLKPHHIDVHLINPGFVETPLTAQNDFKMPALISPEEAALEIIHGIEKGQFEIHFPKRFTRWLKLMRLLPYSLYFYLTQRFTGL